MINTIRKPTNHNGQDMLLSTFEIEFAQRSVYLTGEITDDLASSINAQLRCLARESHSDIQLYLQSIGGSLYAALSIFDTIKSLSSICDISTVACGVCASSAAFLLAAAGTKGKRYCMPNAEVMIHQPLGGAQGQVTDILIAADHLKKSKQKLNTILAEVTGQSLETIEKDVERDNWMTAEEALDYGLVDHIGSPSEDTRKRR